LLSIENAFPLAAQSRRVTSEILDTIVSFCLIIYIGLDLIYALMYY
jgi:hypothetical protein